MAIEYMILVMFDKHNIDQDHAAKLMESIPEYFGCMNDVERDLLRKTAARMLDAYPKEWKAYQETDEYQFLETLADGSLFEQFG